ncbi:MAG: hypothetical protein QM576_10985 [Rhodopseudomonas sp.]|uniref:hypothetical protein n=1 Tax=Rhodopseudomonas sp. TaxID=1078 RepID=UPI0039E3A772
MNSQEQFRVEELKAAHLRIDQEIATMNNFEIVSVFAIGAVYFTFFSQRVSDHGVLVILSLLPVIICGYGLFRYRGHASIVQVHEKYIKSLEEKFLGSPGLVGHYDANKSGQLKNARFAFWLIMFLLSFAVLVVSVVCPDRLAKSHPPIAANK